MSSFVRVLCRGVFCFLFRWIIHGENCERKSRFFGFFQKSQNMSHGNGCSTFVFQVMGILKPRTVSTDKGLQLSHSPMVGCNLLYGSNFDFHMTYFASRPRPVNLDHARPWLCPRIGKWTPPLIDCCGTHSNGSRQIDSWPCQVPFMLYISYLESPNI